MSSVNLPRNNLLIIDLIFGYVSYCKELLETGIQNLIIPWTKDYKSNQWNVNPGPSGPDLIKKF